MIKLVLGEESAEMYHFSFESYCSPQNMLAFSRYQRASDTAIQKTKNAGLFSIQLDESAVVQSCSQLKVFARYVHSGDMTETFLFCNEFEVTAKGEDVMEKLTEFFEAEDLEWCNLYEVCTDGQLGSRGGLVTLIKE